MRLFSVPFVQSPPSLWIMITTRGYESKSMHLTSKPIQRVRVNEIVSVSTLTVLVEDQQNAGGDLHDLGQHHSRGGQVPRSLRLQGA